MSGFNRIIGENDKDKLQDSSCEIQILINMLSQTNDSYGFDHVKIVVISKSTERIKHLVL